MSYLTLVSAGELDHRKNTKDSIARHHEPDVVEHEHVVGGEAGIGRNELEPVGGDLERRPCVTGYPAADQLSYDLVRGCCCCRILQFFARACGCKSEAGGGERKDLL